MNLKERILWAVIAAVLICFLVTFQGCKVIHDVEYVHHYDTVRVVDVQKDSIFMHDSVYIQKLGDTVFIEKYRDRIKYISKVDTVYRVKTDTVAKTETVEKIVEVEKKKPVRNMFALIGVFLLIAFLARVVMWIRNI